MWWLYFVEVKLIGHYPGKPERFTGKEQLVREEVFKNIYVGFRTGVSWDQKTIECVHLTSSNSQIQNKRATKDFILIRHKRYQIYTCLQLSSSIASFVWKPAHFELRSYGGAWHNTKIRLEDRFCRKIYTYLVIFGHFRSLSIRKSAFQDIFWFGLDNQSTRQPK